MTRVAGFTVAEIAAMAWDDFLAEVETAMVLHADLNA